MKINWKVYLVICACAITSCNINNPEDKEYGTPQRPLTIKFLLSDSVPVNQSQVALGQLTAHYENRSKECRSGGSVYGPVRYPRRQIALGAASVYHVASELEDESKCQLTLVGLSGEVWKGKVLVNAGISLHSVNQDGVYTLNCFLGPQPPGHCVISGSADEATSLRNTKHWFARIQFQIN